MHSVLKGASSGSIYSRSVRVSSRVFKNE